MSIDTSIWLIYNLYGALAETDVTGSVSEYLGLHNSNHPRALLSPYE